MLPLEFSKAQILVLWTLPLATAYGLLGVLRGYQNERAPKGVIGSVTQASAFAADRLQAAGRKLQYVSASSASDMRIQYFLSTLESVCVSAPFLWGLLPGVVLKLGAPFGVRPLPVARLIVDSFTPAFRLPKLLNELRLTPVV